MKNIIQNFYLLSKLSISISLLIILILLGFLFFKSYSKLTAQNDIANSKENVFFSSIKSNSEKIEKIEMLIDENNSKLVEIIDSLNSQKGNQSDDILNKIQNDFDNIKIELKEIKNNFQKEKTSIDQPIQANNNNSNIENTVQLIKYKFENGQDYIKELELLAKLISADKNYIVEKLYLLNNKRFVGTEILETSFKKETNNFISNNLFKTNRITKMILSYINIKPSQKKKLSDIRLITINNISKEIENKNYSNSII